LWNLSYKQVKPNKTPLNMQLQKFEITEEDAGKRLDTYLSEVTDYSRSQIKKQIKQGRVQLNEKIWTKASRKLVGNEELKLKVQLEETAHKAEKIELEIIFEDEEKLIINKDPNLVVHPNESGHSSGTLVNALLHHLPEMKNVGSPTRPGIVHRLDKDTSGAIFIAKTQAMYLKAVEAFQERVVEKTYLTLVAGHLKDQQGTIDAPIKRSMRERKQMSIHASGKNAITHYNVIEQFKDSSLLEVQIETGRTHQIRLHMASIGHPVIGDQIYGNEKINADFKKKYNLKRQFLHAQELTILGETYLAPIKKDLQEVLDLLRSE
jgi:23S rRNA pseudouridine1911/1915/1917 synthase